MSQKRGKRYAEGEILKILKEAEGSGKAEEILQKYGVSTASYYV